MLETVLMCRKCTRKYLEVTEHHAGNLSPTAPGNKFFMLNLQLLHIFGIVSKIKKEYIQHFPIYIRFKNR